MRSVTTAGVRAAAFAAPFGLLLAGAPDAPAEMAASSTAALGNGSVSTFAELDGEGAPQVIGLRFEDAALQGLPGEINRTGRCFDLDGDGELGDAECEGDYELRLPLPPELAGRDDIPFRWAMVNWNPRGHPPAVWQVGHFDMHFYILPEAELDEIGVGPCGIFIDCEDFERARVPVPPQYVHPDHVSVDAAVGGMGNHLIDSQTPELLDPSNEFTHSWIFGAYDGRVIFYEVMLTPVHMTLGQPGCHPIKQPQAWAQAGWYPTSYCIRYDAERAVHEVTMEDFVLREAS